MVEENITRIQLDEKEIILLGTAHVSKHSVEQVKTCIEVERPDTVCVELDEQRYQSVMSDNGWKEMDIFKVVKEKKSSLLLINLVASSFQKRLAGQFGIKPGQEMIQGIESAKEIGAHLVLADRNIQITFSRIWHQIGFFGKAKLLFQLLFSIFNQEEVTEEEIEKLKSKDALQAMLSDLTDSFPKLKKPLVDERDQYLAQNIKEAPGKKIVAVLGAAHVPGITKEIYHDHDLQALAAKPEPSKWPKLVAWFIPLLLLGIIGYTFFANPSAGLDQTLSWIIWNGAFSALGAAIAFGHPLAIITAFVVAPISSLNPLIAAGWFSGLVQALLHKPKVEDFERLSTDVYSIKGFWNNKVTRILLIVVLTNIGSALGTLIAGIDVVRVFLENL